MIEQGRLAVCPKLKDAIGLIVKIIEWAVNLFVLIQFFG